MNTNNLANILVIEDNEGDVDLMRLSFEDAKIKNTITVAEDAEIALDILHKRNGREDSPKPDVIFLDLNLPKMSGHEFLEQIQHDEKFNDIPVVVLSSSVSDSDILTSHSLNAHRYMVKPITAEKFFGIIATVEKCNVSVVVDNPDRG
ncbi:MAG: response regulator [Pseudomonadota bacterium]